MGSDAAVKAFVSFVINDAEGVAAQAPTEDDLAFQRRVLPVCTLGQGFLA
ncbi:unnamed protein product [Effrenium voratum]|uniref:Uncharacterized protein n=1 Tax=Effrenium voratum TaxID=2562239 RepID=A0AA36JAV8_9DINO|nr:unnamed protein product [Effrenium voratum]